MKGTVEETFTIRGGHAVRWLLLVALGLSTGGCTDDPPARHLVLLTVDTWRADHAITTQGGHSLTPALNSLSRTSTRFTSASSVSNQTSPGLTGILTGLYPFRSGVLINDHVLPPGLPTLATVLGAVGFSTGAFVANPVVGPGFGFDSGFGHYELIKRPPNFRKAKARTVNEAALSWVDGINLDSGHRLFLWVHYMEPHGPYQPNPDCRGLFNLDEFGDHIDVPLLPPGRNDGRGGVPFYQQAGFDPIPIDGRDYLMRYAAEVRCVDAAIGELLNDLDRRGILTESVVVVTADHGEALIDDHGFYFSHDNGLTEDQTAVPLILRIPGQSNPRLIEEPVSTADILPTVLDALTVPQPPDVDGVSLISGVRRPVVTATHSTSSLRQGRWKLVYRPESDSVSLFDLKTDPLESTDLADTMTEVREMIHAHLQELLGLDPVAHPINRRTLDSETREQLRALGYTTE